MNTKTIFREIEEHKLIAVVRTATADQALAVSKALAQGGIRLIEITMTIPGATEVIKEMAPWEGITLGAGTVLSPAQALEVIKAGARFVVSPTGVLSLVPPCREAGAACILGGLTPTEIVEVSLGGADMVKVFPADAVGGPSYIKALLAPLPDLKLMPSGGVKEDNLRSYLEAGVVALALGSDLLPRSMVEAGDFPAIKERAKRYVAALEKAQEALGRETHKG